MTKPNEELPGLSNAGVPMFFQSTHQIVRCRHTSRKAKGRWLDHSQGSYPVWAQRCGKKCDNTAIGKTDYVRVGLHHVSNQSGVRLEILACKRGIRGIARAVRDDQAELLCQNQLILPCSRPVVDTAIIGVNLG